MNLKQKSPRSLAAWRNSRKPRMGQRAAAAQFGISQPYWSLIETGKLHPRPKLAQRLAQVTGVPLEVLLGIAS